MYLRYPDDRAIKAWLLRLLQHVVESTSCLLVRLDVEHVGHEVRIRTNSRRVRANLTFGSKGTNKNGIDFVILSR